MKKLVAVKMTDQKRVSAEYLADLANRLDHNLAISVGEIREINQDINVLSINAKIEAARAGAGGKGFVVVADNIRRLVSRTDGIVEQMTTQVSDLVRELSVLSGRLGIEVRGQYFSQAAFNAIDIVDRNLYERSCDVRWWAADPPLSEAIENPSLENRETASRRLSQILDSYTVYYDLVLIGADGTVIANGRPQLYSSRGMQVKDLPWFKAAAKLPSQEEFAFQTAHQSTLVKDATVLAYSCPIFNADGSIVGVLGILFRWLALGTVAAQHAVAGIERTGMAEGDIVAAIVTPEAQIIASTNESEIGKTLDSATMLMMQGHEMRHGVVETSHGSYLVGSARAPGYEGYSTGWYGVVRQRME